MVWGKIPKKLHPKNAKIVGCPYFKKSAVKNSLSTQKKTGTIRILILWTPPFGTLSLFKSKSNNQTLKDLIKGLSNLPQSCKITLRPHPSYYLTDDLNEILPSENFSLSQQQSAEEEIKNHDIIVTGATTAGLIAILYKKPLLFFDNSYLFEKFGEPFTQSKSAINVPVKHLRKIDKYILRLINNQGIQTKQGATQEKFINNYCSFFGEDSNEVIAKFINRIME